MDLSIFLLTLVCLIHQSTSVSYCKLDVEKYNLKKAADISEKIEYKIECAKDAVKKVKSIYCVKRNGDFYWTSNLKDFESNNEWAILHINDKSMFDPNTVLCKKEDVNWEDIAKNKGKKPMKPKDISNVIARQIGSSSKTTHRSSPSTGNLNAFSLKKSSNKKKTKLIWVILPIVFGLLLLICAAILSFWYLRRRKALKGLQGGDEVELKEEDVESFFIE